MQILDKQNWDKIAGAKVEWLNVGGGAALMVTEDSLFNLGNFVFKGDGMLYCGDLVSDIYRQGVQFAVNCDGIDGDQLTIFAESTASGSLYFFSA